MLPIFLIYLASLASDLPSSLAQSTSASDPDVCVSRGCIEVASYLLQSLNSSADPCNDFYNFACGNWAKSHLFGEGFHRVMDLRYKKLIELINDLIDDSKSIDSTAFKKMHHYLDVCKGYAKNDTRIEKEILPLLEELPPLSVFGDKFDESKFNFTHLLANLFLNADDMVTINILLSMDFGNSTMNSTFLPGIKVKSARYNFALQDQKTHAQYIIAMRADLKETIELLQLYLKKDSSKINISSVVEDFISVATKLAELEIKHLQTTKVKIISEQEFKQIFPMLDPRALFSIVIPGLKYDISNGIAIENEPLIREIAEVLKQDLSQYANLFGIEYFTSLLNVYKSADCIQTAKQKFDSLINHLFVKRFMTQQDVDVGTEMMDNLMVAVEEVFAEADWLDEPTRTKAIEKARAAYMQFGPHPHILNLTSLDEQFAKLDILNENDWIRLLGKFREFSQLELAEQMGASVSRDYYAKILPMTEYNAVNVPFQNSMVFYAGFTQAPLYRGYYPAVFNYGSIGFFGGHEITHSYDNQGKNYGPYGAEENWWTAESESAFTNRSQCFIDYFNNVTDELSGMNENGQLTLGENIADAGGIAIVYKAFQNYKKKNKQSALLPGLTHFSEDQIFFLSSAQFNCAKSTAAVNRYLILTDEHALDKFRVRNIATNTKEFAEAFKCPKGSVHNPEKRCKIW